MTTAVLTKRISAVAPSATLAITAKAKAMIKEGVDVVSFGAGEPDFDTPAHIKAAAKEALDKGLTKYTPASGTPELKQAVCEKFKRDNGLDYTPKSIIISCGAKHSLYNAVQVLCEEGDEILISAPYWVTYPEQARLASAKPVLIETTEATGFKVTEKMLRAAVTPRTKAFFLNSPSNPTGAVYTKEELEAIARVAVEKGFYIISDEIYEKILYGGTRHYSIASFNADIKRLTVTVNGLSKAYSMTGWRLGYLAAEPEIAAAINNLQSHSTSNPTTFAMAAAVVALNADQSCVADMVKAFDERRKVIVERLNRIRGIACTEPWGAFYVFPNISQLGMDSTTLAKRLLDEVKVAVVPGKGFGADAYIRLSYATSMEKINKGLDRIEQFVNKL